MLREPTRRLLPALAASLGVHGLLWLALEGGTPVSRQPPPASSPALEWVDVEVAEARAPRDAVAAEAAPSAERAPPTPAPDDVGASPETVASEHRPPEPPPPDNATRTPSIAQAPP
ncbi:hypothetical protein ACLEPN_39325, partial [Myxococcus sp. 1LA]